MERRKETRGEENDALGRDEDGFNVMHFVSSRGRQTFKNWRLIRPTLVLQLLLTLVLLLLVVVMVKVTCCFRSAEAVLIKHINITHM